MLLTKSVRPSSEYKRMVMEYAVDGNTISTHSMLGTSRYTRSPEQLRCTNTKTLKHTKMKRSHIQGVS